MAEMAVETAGAAVGAAADSTCQGSRRPRDRLDFRIKPASGCRATSQLQGHVACRPRSRGVSSASAFFSPRISGRRPWQLLYTGLGHQASLEFWRFPSCLEPARSTCTSGFKRCTASSITLGLAAA